MTKIEVITTGYSEITREASEDDEWDRDSTRKHTEVQGIKIIDDPNRYTDITVEYDIDKDETYYLLCATYTTGDSFGTDEGNFTIIDLYDDKDLAEFNAKLIRTHADIYASGSRRWSESTPKPEGYQDFSLKLYNHSNKEYEYGVSWNGYFESLEEVYVVEVSLQC